MLHALRSTIRPWHAVLLTLLLYLAVLLAMNNGDPLVFATIGSRFADRDPQGTEGYDGQFVYFIATQWSGAVEHLDVPAYRFQRILLPLLARCLGLGRPYLIAWALVLLNVVAQTAGTYLVEQLLRGMGVERWYALTYGLWAGLVHAVRLDLYEPLSYALIAAALLAHQRGHLLWTAVYFSLAAFAKETALVFVAAYLVWALVNGRWRSLAVAGLVVGVPLAAWQAWLFRTFGAIGLDSGGALATPFEIVPFMGIWRIGLVDWRVLLVFLLFLIPLYVLPSLAGIWSAARALRGRDLQLWVWTLGVNAALIPFTPFSTFREPWAMLRFGTGLVLAWLLYAAHARSARGLRRTLYWTFALVFLIQG